MNRPLAVLRPEPGNAATAARIEALGRAAIRLPLFAVRPLAWEAPYPADHDAILLTSANTLRHGGLGLAALRHLPAFAVGEATATAARAAGFDVVATGARDGAALVDLAQGQARKRLLLLGGRERTLDVGGAVTAAIAVYASEPLPVAADRLAALDGAIALLHSARAARRLADLVAAPARARIALAAISHATGDAAGPGWRSCALAAAPADAALLDAALSAATLAD